MSAKKLLDFSAHSCLEKNVQFDHTNNGYIRRYIDFVPYLKSGTVPPDYLFDYLTYEEFQSKHGCHSGPEDFFMYIKENWFELVRSYDVNQELPTPYFTEPLHHEYIRFMCIPVVNQELPSVDTPYSTGILHVLCDKCDKWKSLIESDAIFMYLNECLSNERLRILYDQIKNGKSLALYTRCYRC